MPGPSIKKTIAKMGTSKNLKIVIAFGMFILNSIPPQYSGKRFKLKLNRVYITKNMKNSGVFNGCRLKSTVITCRRNRCDKIY